MTDILVYPSGKLMWNSKEFRCAIGRNGVSEDKKEGDGTTPVGCFPLRQVFYRSDRLAKPRTKLPIRALTPTDGWSDEPDNPAYNTLIKLPRSGSSESLFRDDNIYDIIVVLGYNDDPPIPGKGSAIFMHIARPNYSPTAGCIALSLEDLLEIIESVTERTKVCVQLPS